MLAGRNLSHLQSCISSLEMWAGDGSLEFFASTAVDGRKLVSLMAFGKGAEVLQAWKPLQPPKVDAENTFKTFGRQKMMGKTASSVPILKRLILVVTFAIVNSTLHSVPCRQGLMPLVLRGSYGFIRLTPLRWYWEKWASWKIRSGKKTDLAGPLVPWPLRAWSLGLLLPFYLVP